jgi:hypothetical protein
VELKGSTWGDVIRHANADLPGLLTPFQIISPWFIRLGGAKREAGRLLGAWKGQDKGERVEVII